MIAENEKYRDKLFEIINQQIQHSSNQIKGKYILAHPNIEWSRAEYDRLENDIKAGLNVFVADLFDKFYGVNFDIDEIGGYVISAISKKPNENIRLVQIDNEDSYGEEWNKYLHDNDLLR